MDFSVIIVGGGPAGLAAAALLARNDIATAVISDFTGQAAHKVPHEVRTVALMQPSVQLLTYLNLWPGQLAARSAPLKALRLVDDTGSYFAAPTLYFAAREINLEAFGWNIPLSNLHAELLNLCQQNKNIKIFSANIAQAITAEDHISLSLNTGETIKGKVAIAADGRNSALRRALMIATKEQAYDQAALALNFGHSAHHHDISTEYSRRAGPFTTVPLPGHYSSLVWMDRPAHIAHLMTLSDTDLAQEIQLKSHGQLGLIGKIGPRQSFAMTSLIAEKFSAKRVLLVGEAGHATPPIGAQGLNLSLRDAALAADLIATFQDPGSFQITSTYHQRRQADVRLRHLFVDTMNKSLLSEFIAARILRSIGVSALKNFTILKQFSMRYGLGLEQDLPSSMRK